MSMPELGSKISLISKADIRYEGKLFTVDPQECTIALSHVQSFGTEDRPTEFKVPAQSQIYNYILFRGSDIKDIKVITPQIALNDPAIVQLSVPPNTMGNFNANYQSMDELGSVNQVGNSYNPMSGVNLNAGPSHKQASESPLILDPQPVIQQKQPMTAQSDVLDLISGGSRSSTPAQPNVFNGQRNSPTFDQTIQTGNQQSPGNGRGGRNQRNRSTSSSDTRKQVRQQGQNYQRNDQQHYQQRNDQQYQRNDFQHQDNNQHFANRQGGNRNMNGRNWNNHQNNQQQQQQQVRRQNPVPSNATGGRSFYNRSTGLPAPSKAQGPRTNSLKFDEDYDFDKANSEFQEIIKKLSRTKIDDGFDDSTEEVTIVNGTSSVNGDSLLHLNDGEQVNTKKNHRVESGNEIGVIENENEGDDDQKTFYDKSKSFFDSISCEAVERSKGHSQRTDWRTERKLNSETFGVAMARRGQYHRGRGGYYNNNNTNYRTNPNSYNNGNNYNNNRQGINYNYRQQSNNGYMRNNPGNRGYNYRPRSTNKQDQRQPNAVSPQRVAVA
ncbi:protein LSM14 homolog B-B isoform X1 [Melanaphis sacchari]|uniref:protein LSM14 homolog B-B isoform X1 n=1 Tax=Melanaphis sacchari TaxID=742174 RepID=UPI000DC13EC2|nr:protein LSM14 homolog B-B isoform X1 [Melanaphis sacchari]